MMQLCCKMMKARTNCPEEDHPGQTDYTSPIAVATSTTKTASSTGHLAQNIILPPRTTTQETKQIDMSPDYRDGGTPWCPPSRTCLVPNISWPARHDPK